MRAGTRRGAPARLALAQERPAQVPRRAPKREAARRGGEANSPGAARSRMAIFAISDSVANSPGAARPAVPVPFRRLLSCKPPRRGAPAHLALAQERVRRKLRERGALRSEKRPGGAVKQIPRGRRVRAWPYSLFRIQSQIPRERRALPFPSLSGDSLHASPPARGAPARLALAQERVRRKLRERGALRSEKRPGGAVKQIPWGARCVRAWPYSLFRIQSQVSPGAARPAVPVPFRRLLSCKPPARRARPPRAGAGASGASSPGMAEALSGTTIRRQGRRKRRRFRLARRTRGPPRL